MGLVFLVLWWILLGTFFSRSQLLARDGDSDGFLVAINGEEVIIPCKPAAPGIQVELVHESSDFNISSFKRDNKIGYVIPKAAHIHGGHYDCIARLGNLSETADYFLTVSDRTELEVHLEYAEEKMLDIGKNLKLLCSVNGNLNVDIVNFEWILPNSEVNLNHRVTITYPHPNSSLLHVKNVTKEDEGLYTCNANLGTIKGNMKINVLVHGNHVCHLELTEGLNITVNRINGNVKWVVGIEDAYSLPNIKWLSPKGVQIETIYGKYRAAYTERITILEIYKVQLNDSGTYNLVVKDKYCSDVRNFTLFVEAKPQVSIRPLNDQYEHEGQYEPTCDIVGYPDSNITWHFETCKNAACEKQKLEQLELTRCINVEMYKKQCSITLEANNAGRIICKACNVKGCADTYVAIHVPTTIKPSIIATVIVAVIIIICLLACVFIVMRPQMPLYLLTLDEIERFEKGAVESINPSHVLHDQLDLLPYDKSYEFPRDKLTLGYQLGCGAFGRVVKAMAEGIIEGEAEITVAVKMIKPHADRSHMKALMSELKILIYLGRHVNVVNLLGASTTNLRRGELLLILEHCKFGNLQNYLLRHRNDFVSQVDPLTEKFDTIIGKDKLNDFERKHAEDIESAMQKVRLLDSVGDSSMNSTPLTDDTIANSTNGYEKKGTCHVAGLRPLCTEDLLSWGFQIARGMAYLASRKVLHGDLASRNILLAEGNIVKIGDFGLAKNMYRTYDYKKRGNGPLPIKWMAIESLQDRIFSTQSDVWSFGIVLWEMFSLGQSPYPGIVVDEKFDERLLSGYRMDKPTYATHEVYEVMTECWNVEPVERPSFETLSERLGNMLNENTKQHYIELNDPYVEINRLKFGSSQDYVKMVRDPSFVNATRRLTPEGSCGDIAQECSVYVHMSNLGETDSEENIPAQQRTEDSSCPCLESADGKNDAVTSKFFEPLKSDSVNKPQLSVVSSTELKPLLGIEGYRNTNQT